MRRIAWMAFLLAACGDDAGNTVRDAREDATDGATSDDAGDGPPPVAISTFVTHLGGNNFEQARDVVVDAQGNVIVVGGTQSPNFTTTPGAYDTTFDNSGGGMLGSGGPMDVFVTKFSPTGAIVWSTLIGGPSYDRAYGVEVDANGDIYIAGRAGAGFPTTAGALQTAFGGDLDTNGLYGPQDGFISKISSDGSTLLWSTYFGGNGRDFIRDLDVDASGIYVGVGELSRTHPYVTSGAYDTTLGANYEYVVAKVALDGTAVTWGTYFGGNNLDQVPSVRVGSDGSVFLIASTQSTDLPTTAGSLQMNKSGGEDFFIAKFAPNGASLTYCTYFGGNGDESHETHHAVVTPQGEVVMGFYTTSTNLTTTANAIKSAPTGPEAFVAKISANGSTLLAGTYIGGNGGEDVQGLAVDAQGRIYVGGSTSSTNLPVTSSAHQATASANGDAFVAELSSDLTAINYMTYMGGGGDDQQRSLAIDGSGNIVTVGQVQSMIPTTAAAQPNYGGGTYDAVVGAFRIH